MTKRVRVGRSRGGYLLRCDVGAPWLDGRLVANLRNCLSQSSGKPFRPERTCPKATGRGLRWAGRGEPRAPPRMAVHLQNQPAPLENRAQRRDQFGQRRPALFHGELQTGDARNLQHVPVMAVPGGVQVKRACTGPDALPAPRCSAGTGRGTAGRAQAHHVFLQHGGRARRPKPKICP